MFKHASRQLTTSIRTNINTIGIVGGGQMGMGIGITTALYAKKKVIVMDNSQTALDKSISFASSWLNGQVKKSKISEQDANIAISNISGVTELQSFENVDFVIEAVTENEQVKQKVF